MPACFYCGSNAAYWAIHDKENNTNHYCDPCFQSHNLAGRKKEMDDFHQKRRREIDEARKKVSTQSGIFGRGRDPQAARHLVFSAMDGADEFVAKLLSEGVHVDATWSGNGLEDGVTALMMAAWKGHDTTVSLLLENGANVRAKDQKGGTVLDYAVIKASSTIVARLLAAGARADASQALHIAAMGNYNPPHKPAYAAVMRLLLDAGGDPNHMYDDGTPLMVAAMNGHTEAVRELLAAGANSSTRNRQGRTAMDFAQSLGRSDVIALLTHPRGSVSRP